MLDVTSACDQIAVWIYSSSIPGGDIPSQAFDWDEMSPGNILARAHFILVHRKSNP